MRILLRPAPSLQKRVRPYLAWGRSLLGLPPDIGNAVSRPSRAQSLLNRTAALIDGVGDDQLERRLIQAGALADTDPGDRVLRYRMRRLLGATAGGCVAGVVASGRGFGPTGMLLLIGLGTGGAVAYGRGRLDRLIEQRRTRMRIELYTVELLLAVQLRVGSSVAAALRQLVSRSSGEVPGELREALRLHDGGMSLGEALRRIAETTPEPHAMRCYRTLASGHEQGADVASSMLALSEDVRDDRREALRRAATKGRALMLVPIVGILAPVLLLFVGAPLPWMVLRGLG
jgi:Flp pilus assembly protein TadB